MRNRYGVEPVSMRQLDWQRKSAKHLCARLSSFLSSSNQRLLIKVSNVFVGVTINSFEYAEETLFGGCADDGLHLFSIRDGASSFDGRPTLWDAVNCNNAGLPC